MIGHVGKNRDEYDDVSGCMQSERKTRKGWMLDMATAYHV